MGENAAAGLTQDFLNRARNAEALIVLGEQEGEKVALIVVGIYAPDYEPASGTVLTLYNKGDHQVRREVIETAAHILRKVGVFQVFSRNIHMDRENAFQRMYSSIGDIMPVGTLYRIDLG